MKQGDLTIPDEKRHPVGQRHETGTFPAASTAQAEERRVVSLGADLPARDIARAAEQVRAEVVALSLLFSPDDPQLRAEVSGLHERLPKGVEIIAGGPTTSSYGRVLRRIGGADRHRHPHIPRGSREAAE